MTIRTQDTKDNTDTMKDNHVGSVARETTSQKIVGMDKKFNVLYALNMAIKQNSAIMQNKVLAKRMEPEVLVCIILCIGLIVIIGIFMNNVKMTKGLMTKYVHVVLTKLFQIF